MRAPPASEAAAPTPEAAAFAAMAAPPPASITVPATIPAGAAAAPKPKLRRAGDDAAGDPVGREGEAGDGHRGEQDGQRILQVELGRRIGGQDLAEQLRADAGDHGIDQDAHAGGDDLAKDRLGDEGRTSPEREGHQDEALERRQLELDDGQEQQDRQDEEGDQRHDPGQAHDEDLAQIPEHVRKAGEPLDLRQQNVGALHAGMGKSTGIQKVGIAESGACRLQSKAGKTVEDDLRQMPASLFRTSAKKPT